MGENCHVHRVDPEVIDTQVSWLSLCTLEKTGSGAALGKGVEFRSHKVDPHSTEYSHSSLVL